MENKAHALAAGIFLIVVTALLAALALWLTRDNTRYTLYELSSKESVSGLQPQASVRYKGVAVGKVTEIGFDPLVPGNVLIRIAVNVDAPIRPTTFAVLGYQGVTGLAHVLLDDAGKDLPPPPSGPSGLPRLPLEPSPLSKLAEQGPAVVAQVQEAAERVNALLSAHNQAEFSRLLTNIGNAADQLTRLGQRLDSTVKLRLDPALAAVPALVQDARSTLQVLQQSGASATEAAQGVRTATERLYAPGGTLAQVEQSTQALATAANKMNDETLPRVNRASDATTRTARRFGGLADNLGENPQSLLYGNGASRPGPGEPGFVSP